MLVGGHNPFEQYSPTWESSPRRGEHKKYLEPTPGELVFQFVVQQDYLLILQLPCQKKPKSTSEIHRISASLSILTLKTSYFEDQSVNGGNAAPPDIYIYNPYTNSINYQPQLVFLPDFSHQQIPPPTSETSHKRPAWFHQVDLRPVCPAR